MKRRIWFLSRLGLILLLCWLSLQAGRQTRKSDETRRTDGIAQVAMALTVGGLVYGPPTNEQDTATPSKIVAQAYRFLERNLVKGTYNDGFQYSFGRPSIYKYGPSQWLWGKFLYFNQPDVQIPARIKSFGLVEMLVRPFTTYVDY
jgi:hypothetical protein